MPSVDIQYFDEYGHSINQKDAFRMLSQRFHGKQMGKVCVSCVGYKSKVWAGELLDPLCLGDTEV